MSSIPGSNHKIPANSSNVLAGHPLTHCPSVQAAGTMSAELIRTGDFTEAIIPKRIYRRLKNSEIENKKMQKTIKKLKQVRISGDNTAGWRD